jgi:hypothetical protein
METGDGLRALMVLTRSSSREMWTDGRGEEARAEAAGCCCCCELLLSAALEAARRLVLLREECRRLLA